MSEVIQKNPMAMGKEMDTLASNCMLTDGTSVQDKFDANGLMYAVANGTGTGTWENKDIPAYRGNISDYKWIVLSHRQSTAGVRNPMMIPTDWFKNVNTAQTNYFQNIDTNASHEVDVYYVSETRIKLYCSNGKDYAVYLMK